MNDMLSTYRILQGLKKKKMKREASLPHRSFYNLVVKADLVLYLTRLMTIQTELQETEVYQDRT